MINLVQYIDIMRKLLNPSFMILLLSYLQEIIDRLSRNEYLKIIRQDDKQVNYARWSEVQKTSFHSVTLTVT